MATVTYLMVGGGGGGGGAAVADGTRGAGGGGAGGLRTGTFAATAGSTLTITVGSGGAGAAAGSALGASGNVTSVTGLTNADGGGRGGGSATSAPATGGSGGGSGDDGGASQSGAAGTAGEGNAGGNSAGSAGSGGSGGGGGGSSAVGANGVTSGASRPAGGAGTSSSITGSPVTYAAGGAGGSFNAGNAGANGTANTGNGGGGADGTSGGANVAGGSGGSGIVVLSFPTGSIGVASTTGSPTFSQSGGNNIYTFNASGSITFGNVFQRNLGSYDQVVTTDAPNDLYKLISDATDSIGGHNGTATGVSFTDTDPLADGLTAAKFDGSTSKITFAPGALSTTCSIEFWIRPDTSQGTFGSLLTDTSGSLGVYYYNGASKINVFFGGSHTNTTSLPNGTWAHIVISILAGSGTFYNNGVADGTFTGFPGFTPLRIGDDGHSEILKASLSRVALYYGVALTSTQALYHFNSAAKNPPKANFAGARTNTFNRAKSLSASLSFHGAQTQSLQHQRLSWLLHRFDIKQRKEEER